MFIPKQAGASPNQSRGPCRALQQTSTASHSSAAAAEANPACSSGLGCAADAMHRCTPVRNIPVAAARLAAGPGLAWLCSIYQQAGRHSMDHLLLLLWPDALSPVDRPGPPRAIELGVHQRPIHPSLKRRERGHPLLIDRDPAITSRLPQLPLNSQLHRRPHLRRRLAAAKEMPRPSASHHRLP